MVFLPALFIFWRLSQLVTLIPVIGMLSWFVHIYVSASILTPDHIVVLFVVSVLAAAWALATLVMLGSTKRSAHFVAFVDLCFVGALIASVYLLRNIAKSSCSSVSVWVVYGNVNTIGWTGDIDKRCAMLKACFAFAIMNILFFTFTSFLVFLMHSRKDVVTPNHKHHHGHHGRRRSRSHSRHRSPSQHHSPNHRSPSHHRSKHASPGAYV